MCIMLIFMVVLNLNKLLVGHHKKVYFCNIASFFKLIDIIKLTIPIVSYNYRQYNLNFQDVC